MSLLEGSVQVALPGNRQVAWLLSQPDTNTGLTYMENEEIVKGITGKPNSAVAYAKKDRGSSNGCGCLNNSLLGYITGRPTFISSELYPTYLSTSQSISNTVPKPKNSCRNPRIGKKTPKQDSSIKYVWSKELNRAVAKRDSTSEKHVPFGTIPNRQDGYPQGKRNASNQIQKDLFPNRTYKAVCPGDVSVALNEKKQICPKNQKYLVNPTKNSLLHQKMSIQDTLKLPDEPQFEALKAEARAEFDQMHIPRLDSVRAPIPLPGNSLQIMRDIHCTSYTPIGSIGAKPRQVWRGKSGQTIINDFLNAKKR